MKRETALNIASQRRKLIQDLKEILIEKLSLPLEPSEIAEDAPLFGSGLGLDSIDALEIVVAVEEKFGVSITDDDMAVFRSINTIADFISNNQEV
ncbi:MAG: phosphopantetheine-binding protein [Pseudomonadota bacterium]